MQKNYIAQLFINVKQSYYFISVFCLLLIPESLMQNKLLASNKNKLHEECLKAADYKGCLDTLEKYEINTNLPITKKNKLPNEDKCFGGVNAVDAWCIAGKGKDLLGKSKLRGWFYRESPENQLTLYQSTDIKSLNVNNDFGRYITRKVIMRKYREFIADRAPQQRIKGGSYSNCTVNSFGSINCFSSAPKTELYGGRTGQTEGVDEFHYSEIYDCDKKEKTLKSKFHKIDELKWEAPGFSKLIFSEACRNQYFLSKSSITEFADKKLRE